MLQEMAVPASAECVVVAEMDRDCIGMACLNRRAGLDRLQRRTQRGDRLVRAVGYQHLTHDGREHDEPHGDEAKPGCQAVAGTWSHGDEQGNAGDSSIARRFFLRDPGYSSGLTV
jgi:hypothetical protein